MTRPIPISKHAVIGDAQAAFNRAIELGHLHVGAYLEDIDPSRHASNWMYMCTQYAPGFEPVHAFKNRDTRRYLYVPV